MSLSTKSIEAAIKEVKGRKRYTERRIALICDKLQKRAVELCKDNLAAFGAIQDQDLYDSIHADAICEAGKFRIFLRANAKHASFVEFGTGIVGAQNPHPQAGKWGGGTYKDGGWYTQADGKDMQALYGWEPHVARDGNIIYFTAGQPAKPFMYNTMVQLREEFPEIVRKVFEK